jgi:hypothetical protein
MVKCNKDRTARRLRRFSDLQSKTLPTQAELETLVNDAVHLFRRGVLRDLNKLGRLKNRAVKAIPNHRGTLVLVSELKQARRSA